MSKCCYMIYEGEKQYWSVESRASLQSLFRHCFSGETVDVFSQSAAVYGISTSPDTDKIFTAAFEDGRVLLYDIRCPASEGSTIDCVFSSTV